MKTKVYQFSNFTEKFDECHIFPTNTVIGSWSLGTTTARVPESLASKRFAREDTALLNESDVRPYQ